MDQFVNLVIPPGVGKNLFIIAARVTRAFYSKQSFHRIIQESNLSLSVETYDPDTHLKKEIRGCEVSLHRNECLVIQLGQPIDFVVSPPLITLVITGPGDFRHFPDHAFERTHDVQRNRNCNPRSDNCDGQDDDFQIENERAELVGTFRSGHIDIKHTQRQESCSERKTNYDERQSQD